MSQTYYLNQQAEIDVTVSDTSQVTSATLSESNTNVVWDTPTFQALSSTQLQITSTPRPVNNYLGGGNGTLSITTNTGLFNVQTYYPNMPN